MNYSASGSIREVTPRSQDEDSRLTALCEARKSVNTEELNRTILDRYEVNERIDKLIAKLQAEARLRLEEDFEQAKAAVREQLQVIEDHKAKAGRLQNEIDRLGDAVSKRESALARARERRAELGPYAAKSDLQRADADIEAAEDKIAELYAQMAPLTSQHHHLVLVEWPKLGEELQRRTGEERRLRSAVEGVESYQHESGLQLPSGKRF